MQGPYANRHVISDEARKQQSWHEGEQMHRVMAFVKTVDADPATDPETLRELKEATASPASSGARIQILELPLELGGDLGEETRSRFTVIVDRAPAHLADSKDFQDAMKDFARDSGAETAFVTSETLEIAEL